MRGSPISALTPTKTSVLDYNKAKYWTPDRLHTRVTSMKQN